MARLVAILKKMADMYVRV